MHTAFSAPRIHHILVQLDLDDISSLPRNLDYDIHILVWDWQTANLTALRRALCVLGRSVSRPGGTSPEKNQIKTVVTFPTTLPLLFFRPPVFAARSPQPAVPIFCTSWPRRQATKVARVNSNFVARSSPKRSYSSRCMLSPRKTRYTHVPGSLLRLDIVRQFNGGKAKWPLKSLIQRSRQQEPASPHPINTKPATIFSRQNNKGC